MNRLYFYFVFLLAALIGLATVARQNDKSGQAESEDRITVHELKRKMDRKENILIIDARSGNSYLGSSVKIKGAIHITLNELDAQLSKLPKNKEIIAYCT